MVFREVYYLHCFFMLFNPFMSLLLNNKWGLKSLIVLFVGDASGQENITYKSIEFVSNVLDLFLPMNTFLFQQNS